MPAYSSVNDRTFTKHGKYIYQSLEVSFYTVQQTSELNARSSKLTETRQARLKPCATSTKL